jgi:hypothetical protein
LRFRWLGWLAAVYAMAAMGCGSDADTTTLVVLVEDCAGLTSDLVQVRVRVQVGGEERAVHDFSLQGAGAVTVPFSFGIAPGPEGPDGRITVIVEGYVAGGGATPAVTYTATDTGFISGQALLLDVCLDTTRTESRPPSTLQVIEPGDEIPGVDAGTPPVDAGTDTGTPPMDAGVDTGTPPVDAGTDEAGVACGTACSGAIGISVPGGRFTPSVSGSSSHQGSCGGSGPEQVYSFTLTSARDVFITTHGASVDTVVYVRACHCEGEEIGCDDDADGRSTSALQLVNLQPGSYHVFVDTNASMSTVVPVDIHITPTSSAGNRCGRPTPLSGATSSGNTCSMTNDQAYSDCMTGAISTSFNGPDRVYYLIVDSPGTVTFDTCSVDTDYDSSLLLASTCVDLDVVACNDDSTACGMSSEERVRSRISESLDPGLYYLWVDGWSTQCGNYTLTTTGL